MPAPRPAAALGVLALLLPAGCGGDEAPSAEDEVRAALAGFAEATAAKDEQRLCDRIFARSLVSQVETAGLPCEQALRVGLQDVKRPTLEVERVTVKGARATARVRSGAAGQPPSVDDLQLVRERGGWRVASLAG